MEFRVYIQETAPGYGTYTEDPTIRDLTTNTFPLPDDNHSMEDLVKAAVKQFRRQFTGAQSNLTTQAPETGTSDSTTTVGLRSTSTTSSTGSPIGPIGEDLTIAAHCLFYTNCTYSCKTDCHSERPKLKKTIPGSPNRHYSENDCDRELPKDPEAIWKEADGIIRKYFDTSRVNEVVATCAFYAAHWYECAGVADCSTGKQGFLTCAGAAPWKGYYQGSPIDVGHGFSGNITQKAMNSGESTRIKDGGTGISRTCT
ncbi:hypothetical protein BV898_18886 [Hypsibius exemplaris]|uniref:Uncharacterized protein n=1 Tax=Hypsibius exemplaris TaxID=2072580 RepID=A0A9X6RNF3_HYPEX|nr:hypothetical protein BV898_18886 [Hypsibius exemplaris]